MLLISAILLGFAATRFAPLVSKYQNRSEADQFITLLALARHTAILKGLHVTVCPAHASRRDRCGRRNQWHMGTLAFEDINANRRLDGRDVVLRTLPPLQHSKVTWRAFRNRSYLLFTPRGMTDWQNGHFLFCPNDDNPGNARQIVLNYAGRTYFSQDSDGDGVHEGVNGKALKCA